jgi:hypothetical protein
MGLFTTVLITQAYDSNIYDHYRAGGSFQASMMESKLHGTVNLMHATFLFLIDTFLTNNPS